MENTKINVLGTEYTVEIRERSQDDYLNDRDGYCDKTSKRIVVAKEDKESELDDQCVYLKTITRHEIIHAFLFESGRHENFMHPEHGHDETMVDWIAGQWHKIDAVFEQLGI